MQNICFLRLLLSILVDCVWRCKKKEGKRKINPFQSGLSNGKALWRRKIKPHGVVCTMNICVLSNNWYSKNMHTKMLRNLLWYTELRMNEVISLSKSTREYTSNYLEKSQSTWRDSHPMPLRDIDSRMRKNNRW